MLVAVLLGATAAAFAVAQRLKLERAPVTAPRFDRLIGPECGCATARAELEFRLRTADVLDATIVDADGDPVRTLVRGAESRRGPARLVWDGRDDAGRVVPDGRYRLRVELARADRTIVIPNAIRVDGTPPRLELVSASPRVMSPDGDGRGDRVLYRYRASERSRAHLYVDGERTVRTWLRPGGAQHVRWRGRLEEGLYPAGTFATWLTLVDEAGNESRPSERVAVRIRYVELAGVPRRARPGALVRFRADADAKRVRWRVTTRSGRTIGGGLSPPGTLSFRAPARPATLMVVASVGARSDRAVIRLR